MTFALSITLGAIFVLLVLSAFFSGSETALTAASRARMYQFEKRGNARASAVNRLLRRRDRLIGGLLFGNNLVNILASALATGAMIEIFGDPGVFYATLVMTALVLVFAEVLPKTYAINHPDRTALFVARPVSIAVALFAPATAAVQLIVRGTLRLFGVTPRPGKSMLSAHDELRGAIDLHHREGGVVRADRYMLGAILDLKELEVSDIMVHRTNMASVNADDAPARILSQVLSSTFTRLPLWRDTPENIIGVLHAKDLARAVTETKGKIAGIRVTDLASDPWFVPDTTTVQDQLNAFLKRKSHFALVVDEYGEVMGLVTLEDILEEIVGDIVDEHDVAITGVRPETDGSVVVDGAVPIRDLNRAMDWHLPDEEATSIAGLVIHEARMIPEQGQTFIFHGFRFEVLRRQRNRVTLLRIRRIKQGAAQIASSSELTKTS